MLLSYCRYNLTLRSLLLCFVALVFAGCFGRAANAAGGGRIEYSDFEPAPTGVLRVARPTVAWRIVPRGSSHVTGVRLSLNSQPVAARYEDTRQAVAYTPSEALRPGHYSVHCEVVLDGEYSINRDWEFNVGAAALARLDEPTTDQKHVCDEINSVRHVLNLPELTMDARLCAAAAAHSVYLAKNREVGHHQDAKKEGYLAAEAGDRVSAYGYAGGCYESISQGAQTGMVAVHGLFDAPYHRAPFLQPGAFSMGAGVRKDIVTLLFGSSSTTGVVTYPADGQKNVPTRWNGIESPSPLRMHGNAAKGPTGYVLTMFLFGPDDPHLAVAHASLTGPDGKDVPIYLNTSDNDDFLRNGVLVIPQQPLRAGVTYRVSIQAKDDTGADCSRAWSFTTAPALTASR